MTGWMPRDIPSSLADRSRLRAYTGLKTRRSAAIHVHRNFGDYIPRSRTRQAFMPKLRAAAGRRAAPRRGDSARYDPALARPSASLTHARDRRPQRPALGDPRERRGAGRRRRLRPARSARRARPTSRACARARSARSSGRSTCPRTCRRAASRARSSSRSTLARRVIARYPDRLALATTADDVERALREGTGRLAPRHGGRPRDRELARRAARVLRRSACAT